MKWIRVIIVFFVLCWGLPVSAQVDYIYGQLAHPCSALGNNFVTGAINQCIDPTTNTQYYYNGSWIPLSGPPGPTGPSAPGNWCNGSSLPVNYGSLPASPTLYCEQWATGLSSACRAHFPPSYLWGGAQQTVAQANISAAFAPFTSGHPSIVAFTQATGTNIAVPSHTDGAGNLLVWFETNFNAYPTTPAGWNLAVETTNSPTSPQFAVMYTRIPSSEPSSYSLTGASFYSSVMYSLSNVANTVTPDGTGTHSDGTGQSGLSAAAMSGLSTSTDLALYAFTWGSSAQYPQISTISATGAIAGNVDVNIPFANGGPSASQGILTANLTLAANSVSSQSAQTPVAGTQTCKVFWDGTEYIEEGY